jgi:hypothetical protein
MEIAFQYSYANEDHDHDEPSAEKVQTLNQRLITPPMTPTDLKAEATNKVLSASLRKAHNVCDEHATSRLPA